MTSVSGSKAKVQLPPFSDVAAYGHMRPENGRIRDTSFRLLSTPYRRFWSGFDHIVLSATRLVYMDQRSQGLTQVSSVGGQITFVRFSMREVVLKLRSALMECLAAATVLADELVRDIDIYGDDLEAEAMRGSRPPHWPPGRHARRAATYTR